MNVERVVSDATGPSHILYIDESMEGNYVVVAAVLIPVSSWFEGLDTLLEYRRAARKRFGLFINYELHAYKFLSGRGRPSKTHISKAHRFLIFKVGLQQLASIPGVKVFGTKSTIKKLDWAFERLLNRVQRNLEDENGTFLIFCDNGKEGLYTPLTRKHRRVNFIPSRYGNGTFNIPVHRMVEDPVFLNSERSYFIQAADSVAYSLLRYFFPRPPEKDPYGIAGVFEQELGPVCEGRASPHELGLLIVD